MNKLVALAPGGTRGWALALLPATAGGPCEAPRCGREPVPGPAPPSGEKGREQTKVVTGWEVSFLTNEIRNELRISSIVRFLSLPPRH